MHATVAKLLDRLAIRAGGWSVQTDPEWTDRGGEAERLLSRPDFLAPSVQVPSDLEFLNSDAAGFRKESRPDSNQLSASLQNSLRVAGPFPPEDFRFSSPVATRWPQNTVVFGKLFRCCAGWVDHPTAVLVHGWNAALCYECLFPWIAKRLQRRGVNAAFFELPYHEQRQPRNHGARVNFISSDLVQMLEASNQAIADARALMRWLNARGCRQVGLWGFSLGAWLAGLVTAVEPLTNFSVLLTPIARMDRAIADLAFCAPIRQSLRNTPLNLDQFNLANHRPRIPPDRILIIASQHDLFASMSTIDELVRAWNEPEVWRMPHGHISVLLSLRTLDRVVDWIAQKTRALAT